MSLDPQDKPTPEPRTVAPVVFDGPNPYPGPRTFRSNEADRFFGREREAQELFSFILSSRTVLFYAQSGAGKSSLVNTRTIPGLTSEGFEVLPVGRVSGESSSQVRQNIFIHNLMTSLEQNDEAERDYQRLSLSDFLLGLGTDEAGRYRYRPVDDVEMDTVEIEDLDADLVRLNRILIIDQFEEILTTNLQAWEQRDEFFDQLREAMEVDPFLHLLLVMREDHVAGLDPYAHRLPDRLQTRYYMERMRREAAIQAVRQPAAAFDRPFEEGVAETLVDNLRLIRVSGYPEPQPGQYIEPVQLQVVCRQLWETIQTRDDGQTISADDLPTGYVEQAMVDFYETALRRVAGQTETPERVLRDWIDRHLITASGTRGIVYRNDEVGNTAGLDNELVDELVRHFILRTEARAGSTWYELVHDRLVESIQDSNRAWQEAVRARRTDALQFANQTQSVLSSNRTDRSDLALLLARESVLSTLTTDGYVEPGADAALQRAVTHAPPWQETLTHPSHTAAILTAFFDEEGSRLLSASLDGTARLWDVQNRRQLQAFVGHQDRVFCAVFSPNEETVLTTGADRQIIQWDITRGEPVARFLGHENEVFCARFSHDGQRIASCGADGSVRIWSVEHEREIARFEKNGRPINWLVFLPSGDELVAIGSEGDIYWLNCHNAELNHHIEPESLISYLWITLDPAGKRLAIPRQDGRVELRNAQDGELIQTLVGHGPRNQLWAACFSPDGSRLLTAGQRDVIELFNLDQGKLEKQYKLNLKLTCTDFHPSGKGFVVAGDEPILFLYDIEGEWADATLGSTGTPLRDVAFSADGEGVLALYSGINLMRWQLENGEEDFRVRSQSDIWQWTALVDGGSRIRLLTSDGRLDEIDVESGTLLDSFRIPGLADNVIVNAAAFDDSGQKIAVAWDQELQICDIPSRSTIRSEHFDQPVAALAFRPGRDELFLSLDDGAIERIHQSGINSVDTIQGEEEGILLKFSPNGEELVAARGPEVIRWNLESSERSQTPQGEAESQSNMETPLVRALVFHPQGDEIATGYQDGTITIRSHAERTPRLQLIGHHGAVLSLAYDQEGERLLSGGADGSLRIWGTRPIREPHTLTTTRSILWSAIDDDGPLICTQEGQLYRCDFERGETQRIPLPIGHWNETSCAWWRDEEEQKELSLFHASGVLLTLNFSEPESRQEFLGSFGSEGLIQVGASMDLIATSDGFSITVWDPNAGAIPVRMNLSPAMVRALAISPDDRYLAAATSDETILIWEIESGREIHRLTGHTAQINAIEFSPDGGWLASAAGSGGGERIGAIALPASSVPITSRDTSVRLWQMSSGRERLRVGSHSRPVRSLRFSPDGRRLLTGGSDGSVRIFDAGNGEEIRRLLAHSRSVNATHYTLDGRHILSSSEHEVSFWRADLNDLLLLSESLIQRRPPILMGYEREQFRSPQTR